jgi:disulfide oxidoreductase YuzD
MTQETETQIKKPEVKRKNITIKTRYKKLLDRASAELTLEFDERITTNDILYKMITNYLDQTVEDIRKEFS